MTSELRSSEAALRGAASRTTSPSAARSSRLCCFRARRPSRSTGPSPQTETGWSVIVQGPTEEIENRAEIRRLEQLDLHPWAPGEKPHWIRIRTDVGSGRRTAP